MKSSFIVGIDEVGRGPIAGPVCVGLVIIRNRDKSLLRGIRDSKKLSQKKREEWFKKISQLKKEGRLDFSYGMVSSSVVDEIGINPAIQKAMNSCCSKCLTLKSRTSGVGHEVEVLLDGGLKAPAEFKNQKTIIGGDDKFEIISAASVVAKISRDEVMIQLAKKFPDYDFDRHKGYGTKEHYKKIKKYGLSPLHRRSFIH